MSTLLGKREKETFARVEGARPLLKWAGGKGQLLNELSKKVPPSFGKYIEPFFGGGALFFHIQPQTAVIADSNPELINLYKTVAINPEGVITLLTKFKNEEKFFQKVRAQDWRLLTSLEAAARTIFLNKTCFNGLYRVNKSGKFNVPFGRYKNPNIADAKTILAASKILKRVKIVLGDYKQVLANYAKPGDFIFLDPPYLPISKYSDFKRYTKEQFYEDDHVELSEEVDRLVKLGCYVVLTNSNHPLVHKLFDKYEIEVVKTKRYINSNASNRTGEDVIVTAIPGRKVLKKSGMLSVQVTKYPSTRYMGSKNKLLESIWGVASNFKFDSVLDLFSGSGVVSYMFKAQGKTVYSSDYMAMAATYAKALVENNTTKISKQDLDKLFSTTNISDSFVSNTFKDLYYTDAENIFIDRIRTGASAFTGYKKEIIMAALIRACVKKRPRGIFTYVGNRYDDGRRDLKTSIEDQFLNAITSINDAVFDNGRPNIAHWKDALTIKQTADLVYIDPPYFSPLSDNEYVRRYHFVEGLARNWEGVEIQQHTMTKKFKSYPTPFSTHRGAADAFDRLFRKFDQSILIVSYSSNSLPSLDEMVEIMSRYKSHVEVVSIDHQYSFGTHANKLSNKNNAVKEYLFVAY